MAKSLILVFVARKYQKMRIKARLKTMNNPGRNLPIYMKISFTLGNFALGYYSQADGPLSAGVVLSASPQQGQ